MKKKVLFSHFKLHFIVLIYGFTAILGKLINLPASQLVWYRMFIASIAFFILIRFQRKQVRVARREVLKLLGVGLVVAAHWICFFGAVKLSNVSVTLGCMASATLFISFLEPLILKQRIGLIEVFIGILVIGGLYMIFTYETQYWQGILVALTSALLAGLFTVFNKKLVQQHSAQVISYYEMIGGFIGIAVYFLLSGELTKGLQIPQRSDIIYLLILGLICTAFAFLLEIDVMKVLSAYNVGLTINLEPVYGIFLAFFIFQDTEHMTGGFYIGTLIILLSVMGYPIYKRYISYSPDDITGKQEKLHGEC